MTPSLLLGFLFHRDLQMKQRSPHGRSKSGDGQMVDCDVPRGEAAREQIPIAAAFLEMGRDRQRYSPSDRGTGAVSQAWEAICASHATILTRLKIFRDAMKIHFLSLALHVFIGSS